MQVPYATTIWWGYVCQPHMRYVVLSLYYASAALGLLTAAFAKSVLYRCASALSFLALVRPWLSQAGRCRTKNARRGPHGNAGRVQQGRVGAFTTSGAHDAGRLRRLGRGK